MQLAANFSCSYIVLKKSIYLCWCLLRNARFAKKYNLASATFSVALPGRQSIDDDDMQLA
jgi:hypothetical protein